MVEGYYPTTVFEALELIKGKEDYLLIAGGTDVMVVHKTAPRVIFLNKIPELKEVRETKESLIIGALAIYCELLKDTRIPAILREAIGQIASPAIRSAGTIGGNICNASPAGDTLPVLYALDAKIVKASLAPNGEIQIIKVPIQEFILGIRRIALMPGEMVQSIEIPRDSYQKASRTYYQKVGARQSEAISKVSFAGVLSEEDGKIREVRIAFGSVGITVVRRREIEEQLVGKTRTELSQVKDQIIAEYEKLLHPISDQRSTEFYRKKVCLNLVGDFLNL